MKKRRFFHLGANTPFKMLVNMFDNLQPMTSSILSIGTAVPAYQAQQSDLAQFMTKYLGLDRTDARRLQVLYNLSGIDTRYSVIPDFTSEPSDFEFFPCDSSKAQPSTRDRMNLYQKHACELGVQAVVDCCGADPKVMRQVTHVIAVSCTGMYAPGLDIDLVQALGLRTNVERTAINFMGCYAAFNALKAADKIVRTEADSLVLIVSVELCSIHFQRNMEEDALVSNALFGDGAAAVLVGKGQKDAPSFSLDAFHSDLFFAGQEDMGWYIRDFGFEMKLTAEVPAHIKRGIAELTHRLLSQIDLPLDRISHYAIHPGGRKILDVIEEELSIAKDDNQPARQVMKQYGNMSSPSVLFALNHIMDRLTPENHQEHILSFAFGPGLTMESMLLTIHHHA